MSVSRSPRLAERELVEGGVRHLQELGFRTWANVDGADYFDLVARRGEEVGLVEAKVADSRAVLAQALTRRVWGDWVAVLLGSRRSAERLAARTQATRASPVGIWAFEDGRVRVVRAPSAWVVPGEADPYADLRQRFRRILDALERGDIPEGLPWDFVPGSVRRASHGRRFREWRLDEGPPRAP
jgi:hypothetical protein